MHIPARFSSRLISSSVNTKINNLISSAKLQSAKVCLYPFPAQRVNCVLWKRSAENRTRNSTCNHTAMSCRSDGHWIVEILINESHLLNCSRRSQIKENAGIASQPAGLSLKEEAKAQWAFMRWREEKMKTINFLSLFNCTLRAVEIIRCHTSTKTPSGRNQQSQLWKRRNHSPAGWPNLRSTAALRCGISSQMICELWICTNPRVRLSLPRLVLRSANSAVNADAHATCHNIEKQCPLDISHAQLW